MVNLIEDMVVHCDTEEKANIFLEECKNQGCKFLSGTKNNHWNINEENTCYIVTHCKPRKSYFILYYGHLDYFKDNNYHIISFNHLNFENNDKAEQLSLF
ncbi:MAG TPA: hypothetical protein DDY58_10150 [Terrisporobacter glycolicus]|uniref:hypothetical protein n=1 Tax=Terrisporobacter TaxID=1505652 RepID=UPI000E985215|nr:MULTISPECIES: hypothetical protein [Terrisporobacter]HBI92753.1 hypothetical protein [Terrisporobacter hibernicus]